MRKILIFGLMFLLLISFATAKVSSISQTQLETYTNLQIENYLINNLDFKKTYSNNQTIFFIYQGKTIMKHPILEYKFTLLNIKANLNKNDWNNCLLSYSLTTCKNKMIFNYGYYIQDKKTIFQQLKEKTTFEYNKIIDYRDNTQNITINGGGNLEI